MNGTLKTGALLLTFFVGLNSFAKTGSIGLELQQTIKRRPENPNEFMRTLERFSVFVPQMNKKEQELYIETLASVYACELKDYKYALKKIEKFKRNYQYNNKNSDLNYFLGVLKGKIYLCSETNASLAVKSFENILRNIIEGGDIKPKNHEAVQLYCQALLNAKNYYKALKFQQRMLLSVPRNHQEKIEARILRDIGLTFAKLDKQDSCLHYLMASYSSALKSQDYENISQTAFELGRFHLGTNNNKTALVYLLQALKGINYLEGHPQQLSLCQFIGNLYIKEGDTKRALFFKEIEFKYADSVKIVENLRSSAIHTYELNKKKHRQIEAQRAYNRVSSRMKWGVFLSITTVSILIFTGLRSKRKSSKRLAASTDLNAIVEKLKNPDKESHHEKEKILNELISDLKTSVSQKKWEDFESLFIEQHPFFLEKLDTQHPKLSSNERKLCICLSQNMSTKEISPLTGQNAHAINIARGRLRKKLGIDHKDIPLPEYLSKFF